MRACMHAYTSTLRYMHRHTHAHKHTPAHTHTHTRTHAHTQRHTHTHTRAHACMHAWMHLCRHVCMHTCRCICAHVHEHVHMHANTVCLCSCVSRVASSGPAPPAALARRRCAAAPHLRTPAKPAPGRDPLVLVGLHSHVSYVQNKGHGSYMQPPGANTQSSHETLNPQHGPTIPNFHGSSCNKQQCNSLNGKSMQEAVGGFLAKCTALRTPSPFVQVSIRKSCIG